MWVPTVILRYFTLPLWGWIKRLYPPSHLGFREKLEEEIHSRNTYGVCDLATLMVFMMISCLCDLVTLMMFMKITDNYLTFSPWSGQTVSTSLSAFVLRSLLLYLLMCLDRCSCTCYHTLMSKHSWCLWRSLLPFGSNGRRGQTVADSLSDFVFSSLLLHLLLHLDLVVLMVFMKITSPLGSSGRSSD